MKTILVYVRPDGDEPWVTDAAAEMVADTGADLYVLSVDDVESQRFEALPRKESLERADAAARKAAERLAERGITARAEGRSGRAADTILETAEQIDASMILVGHPTRRPLAQRLLGGVTQELIEQSPRHVMVIGAPR